MGISWWRSWHGAPMDQKWLAVAARSGVKTGIVIAIAWALLDYASQQKNRGSINGFDTETFAVFSGFDEADIIAVIKAMTDKKIIVDDTWSNWEKRQPKREDDSNNRVKKYREKQNGNVTHCNTNSVDVTHCNAESENVTLSSVNLNSVNLNSVNLESVNDLDLNDSDIFLDILEKSNDADSLSIFQKVTSYPDYIGNQDDKDNQRDAIVAIKVKCQRINVEPVEYLRPFFTEFKRRYPRNTKSFWLTEWAMTGEIPPLKLNGKVESNPYAGGRKIE